MKKQSVKFENESGSSFTLHPKDFIYFIHEALSELQDAKIESQDYKEQRRNLLSVFYTYQFCAKEYHWNINKDIEALKKTVMKYCNEESTAYYEPALKIYFRAIKTIIFA